MFLFGACATNNSDYALQLYNKQKGIQLNQVVAISLLNFYIFT